MRPRWGGLLLGVLLAVGACSSGATPPTATEPATPSVELTIYGAASLKDVLEDARAAYEAANPGTTLTVSTDSSAALATQIEQGAPADVFLAADARHPAGLVTKGLADGDPVTFAANRLTIVVPADNPAGIASPSDLARPGIRIIAVGDEAPITTYAAQLVRNLAGLDGYPADFAAAYAANVASKEDNVKALVAKVELGEGDAGIVYTTDAKAADHVATVDVPASANVPARYDGVVLRASAHPEAARAFLRWFAGPDGQAILASFGFTAPSS